MNYNNEITEEKQRALLLNFSKVVSLMISLQNYHHIMPLDTVPLDAIN